ncbi:cytochrome c biogenesis protein CcsA [Thermophagus sp. OGC60D27]|uniref:cytochrome c biogenesis protein CcsA n=1 Tax=Thermophagus sp. OGC60D27 TaxID=3458415 RepID=UPI0040383611
MERIVKLLTSRQLMGVLFFILATVLAVATFLENDFGYRAARAMVYNTWWFELIFVLMGINMFGNLFNFNLWRWEKAPVLLFHCAFFIIIAGAAITRYTGYEGKMHIREGKSSETILTVNEYVSVEINDRSGTKMLHKPVFLSAKTPKQYSESIKINGKKYCLKSTSYIPHSAMAAPSEQQAGQIPDVITFILSDGKQSQTIHVAGRPGEIGKPKSVVLNNGTIQIRYGALPLELPFALHLNKFELERYPGSESPSSYASEVTVIDPQNQIKKDYRIFMNNILNYRGFRFYQSSYDPDEKGTILSVNHDFAGTFVTYLGYILLSISMIWSLFAPHTRFRQLLRKTNNLYKQKTYWIALLILVSALPAFGNEMPPRPDSKVATAVGKLWVQDKGGRIKPLNTLHQDIMIKLVKHNSFNGFSPDQMLLGILIYPDKWGKVPIITVKHPQLKKLLGIKGRKASFNDFFSSDQIYKIHQHVNAAYRKNPAERNKLEQELIKVDEQVNVFYLAKSASLLRIFPVNNNPDEPWLSPTAHLSNLTNGNSLIAKQMISSIIESVRNDNNNEAIKLVHDLKTWQSQKAGHLIPSDTKMRAELLYNKLNIFMWLATFFFVLGVILVTFHITVLIYPSLMKKWIKDLSITLIMAGFTYHSLGLALRWYVSGHAPWSNGYESMLLIAWVLLLAGLLFSRHSPLVLSVTALFAGIVLMVSHLSWMNPEITNLVPVLKSYWLTLHVAVIIGGYGFLTLGALLGFMNLFLTALQSRTTRKRIKATITELTAINEMSLIVGLYLMTIGSFLGGIWANESWGRYWGWDPKETWSLITILIYAFVIHMRLIPGLRGTLAFNTASLLAFASVIMTYLGVNYYLTGMHSYASGDALPIPTAVYYSVVVVTVMIIFAFRKESAFNHEIK